MRIGLTGGIACGKSTAAALFQKHGARVISSDKIAHEILALPEVKKEIAEVFGTGVFDDSGNVDRAKLGEIVFRNPEARRQLENITHPRINAAWMAEADAAGERVKVVELPLLFENKLETAFDLTVCVHCHRQTQTARMTERGLTAEQAESRLRAQAPIEEKIRRADCCLFNEGTLSFLEQQILLLPALNQSL